MTETTTDGRDWFGDDAATFGDRLSAAREAQGLSQEDLARRLGVKLKTIVAWENDWNEPRANKLQMVAGLLSVSIRWLLTGEGDGVGDPDISEIGDDLNRLLMDLRQIRQEHSRLGEHMGRLEKRLRVVLRREEQME